LSAKFKCKTHTDLGLKLVITKIIKTYKQTINAQKERSPEETNQLINILDSDKFLEEVKNDFKKDKFFNMKLLDWLWDSKAISLPIPHIVERLSQQHLNTLKVCPS
jgi:hypothetical protein